MKTAESGEQALELLKRDPVDLVLDMIMVPGIDGLETYERIIKLHPKQKAIIASGYSETDRVKKAQRLGAGRYVKKPYTVRKIGLAVKGELAKQKEAIYKWLQSLRSGIVSLFGSSGLEIRWQVRIK